MRLLIAERPDEPTPWLQLLMLQVGRKQFKDAAATVEQIRARVKAERPELLWAQCYRVVGDRAKADDCYREALRLWPDDVAVRSAAISYYEQTGRPAEAEAALPARPEAATPRSAGPRGSWRCSWPTTPGDRAAWDEALALVGPAAKSDDAPDDRLARAGVYAKGPEAKHRQEAIVILEELASELPNAATVHEPLARLLREAGRLDEARAHAAKAAAGEDANPEAILLYTGILLGDEDCSTRPSGSSTAWPPSIPTASRSPSSAPGSFTWRRVEREAAAGPRTRLRRAGRHAARRVRRREDDRPAPPAQAARRRRAGRAAGRHARAQGACCSRDVPRRPGAERRGGRRCSTTPPRRATPPPRAPPR